jgi:hypothetical protein
MKALLKRKYLITLIHKLFNMGKSYLLLFLLLFSCNISLIAQSKAEYSFGMTGFVDTNQIILRWAPLDVQSWIAGKYYGYKLSRFIYKNEGIPLEPEDVIASEEVLVYNIKPLPVEEWMAKIDTNLIEENYAGIAAGAIYGDTFEIEELSEHPAIRSFNSIKEQESRFSYGLMAADMDYTVAMDLGLGYIDNSASTDGEIEYMYIVTLSDEADPKLVKQPGVFLANPDSMSVLESIDTLFALPGDKAVAISWAIPLSSTYTAYNVEKSIDSGQTYIKVNDLPVVVIDGEYKSEVSFTDSLPNNSTIVSYRVRGLNAFGMQGPPSDTIQVKGKPSRLTCYALINGIEESLNNQMAIQWQLLQVDDINLLQELNLYRSPTHNGTYIKVNSEPLPPSQTQYTDSFPEVSNYYKVIITDINGYEYESIHSLAQHADSIPPIAPVSLNGTCDKTGLVKLKWNKNTEEDLQGYRVYLSNFADSFYVQITKSLAIDSFYSYTTNINTLTKKLYFRVTAEDNRHNMSEMSATCEITRPDIVPPANPVLYNANATPPGIELSFVCSPSIDVKIHKLQKRKKGARIWSTIYTIDDVQLSGDMYAFLDSSVTHQYIYQYRVLAYDEAGNYSSSKLIELRGFDSGIRGNIFDVEVDKVEYTPSNTTTFDTNFLNRYPNTVNIVQWRYTDTSDIYNFQIYRSVDDSPFRIYDVVYLPQNINHVPQEIQSFINTAKFWYVDLRMLGKYSFEGALNGGQSGSGGGGSQGGGSGPNNNGERTYKYKIIANHRDGSTSILSSDVNIVVN